MQIGRFQIVEPVGEGSSGTVFLARDPAGRPRALKLLADASPGAVQRFQREGGLLMDLGELQGLVPILELGQAADGRPFLVFPYLSGGTLQDRLQQGPLSSVERAVELTLRLAEALGRVHALGVVHRDVKPANVLFDDERNPLLTDLGLAKLVAKSSSLSLTGQLRGSLAYMPPEQAEDSKHVTAAADVYALGAVLFECLAGTTAYEASGGMTTLASGGSVRPASLLRPLRPDTPTWLLRVISRCLAPDPSRRYRDGASLAAALRRGAGPDRRALGVAAASLLAVGLAVGLLWPGPAADAQPTPPPVVAASTDPTPEPARDPLAELEALLARSPLPWEEVATASAALAGRPGAQALVEHAASSLAADAVARSAQGGPFDPTAADELDVAIELLAHDPEQATRMILRKAQLLYHRERRAEARAAIEAAPPVGGRLALEVRLFAAQAKRRLVSREEGEVLLAEIARDDPEGVVGLTALASQFGSAWRYAESAELAQRVLAQEPDYLPALIQLAVATAYRGRTVLALETTAKALELAPDSVLLHRLRARALAAVDVEAAIEGYGKAIELALPQVSKSSLKDRGWLFFREQRLEEARADLDRAVEHSDSGEELIFRGVIRWAQGDQAGAILDWRVSHERGPEWFLRRLGDMPAQLWETMCEAVGAELPQPLRQRLEQLKRPR